MRNTRRKTEKFEQIIFILYSFSFSFIAPPSPELNDSFEKIALKWNPIQFTPSWRPSEINNSHTKWKISFNVDIFSRSFSGNHRKLWIEIAWKKNIKTVDVGVIKIFSNYDCVKKIKRARIGEFTRRISTSVVLEEWCFTILCQK